MRVRARPRPSRIVAGARPRPNRLVRRGVAGVVLAFVVLGALQAISVPVFQPPDELSHWGYARIVAEGELPTISTPIPVEGVEYAEQSVAWRSTQKYRTVWVANHPPLYYVVMAAPLQAGIEMGHPVGAVQVARVLSVLIAAGGIALLAGVVRELVPGRPALAVAAAGLTAAVPTFVKTASDLYNDSLAFTTAMATLLLAVRIVLRGPTGLRVFLLAVFASASALTRASGLVVAGVAGLAVAIRPFLPSPPGTWRGSWAARAGGRVAEAVRHGGFVGLAVAASAGWFYQRNLTMYGDLTGAQALLDVFEREFRKPLPEILTWWVYWRDQLRNLMDYTFNMTTDAGPSGWLWLVVALPVLGGLVGALRGLRRHLTGGLELPPERAATRTHRAAAIGLLVVLMALVEVALAQFYRDGGGLHARYLLPTMPLLTLAAAAGLAALPGGRRGLPTGALLAGFIVVNLWLWNQYLWIVIPPQPPQHTIEVALAAAEAPEPSTLLIPAGVLLLVSVALQVSALWSLGASRLSAVPPPLAFQVERVPEEPGAPEEPEELPFPEEPEELLRAERALVEQAEELRTADWRTGELRSGESVAEPEAAEEPDGIPGASEGSPEEDDGLPEESDGLPQEDDGRPDADADQVKG